MIVSQFLPFGEWLPDQPDLGNAVTVVKNCIPQAQSYRSAQELNEISTALDSKCLGAAWALDNSNTYYNFAGDAGKLYLSETGVYNNKSKSGNYTGVTNWEFVVWGERVIATSIEEPMQYFDMGVSTLFADLAGSPPKAKHVAVVRDFIVAGNVDEGGTIYPNRIRWSGYNNSEAWASSQATQSDFQDLLGRGGEIQRIVPGETGVIFQEHAIRRMTYIGPPLIFRIDEIEKDRGCYAPNSVAWTGDTIFYYSHDGFYVKHGDAISQPIGTEKIDRWFKTDFDTTDILSMRGAIDRKNKIVAWCYPSRELGANRVLIYRWDIQKWSYIDEPALLLLEHVSVDYTLDSLDVILTDIDTESIPMETDAYLGGVLSLGAFNDAHKLCTFSGAHLQADIETGELSDTHRISVKSIRPLTDGTTAVSVGTRENQNLNYAYGLAVSENIKGEMSVRTSARHHRFKASISGGFNHAQGLKIHYRQEGRR